MEMTDNMELYNKLRQVPEEAKKPIGAGRLKGFTDINPMWRIKALTETFGPCGIGWWYKVTDKRLEGSGNEIRAFVDIELYYVWEGKTSQPVVGTGGSSFLTQERSGAYTSDECYKMALTDAISVAAKMIGCAADVYYAKDRDKYTTVEQEPKQEPRQEPKPEPRREERKAPRQAPPPPDVYVGPHESADGFYYCDSCGMTINPVTDKYGKTMTPRDLVAVSIAKFGGRQLCAGCMKNERKAG